MADLPDLPDLPEAPKLPEPAPARDPGKKAGRGRLVAAFWGAAALSVLLTWIPHGHYLLYPFSILSTWAHEMGHGLTAILVGGSFTKLEIFSNLGGLAYHAGGPGWGRPLVSAGGLLGPAFAGGAMIVLGSRERTARWVLAALSVAILLSVAIWVRSLFGFVSLTVIGALFALVAIKSPVMVRLVLAQLVGIQFCLKSLSSFDYMFTKTIVLAGKERSSDTQAIAEVLLLPYWFWGALIAAMTLAILAASFYVAWMRRPKT